VRNGDGVDDVAEQEVTPEQAFELLTKYPLTS
jgi:hypothetical protein